MEKNSPMIKCYVVRSQSGVLGGKTYNLFLEPEGGGPPGGGTETSPEGAEKRFLVSARKKGGESVRVAKRRAEKMRSWITIGLR